MAAWIGISGYDYASWRGKFYPMKLAHRRWLDFAAHRFHSIELNGTFYSLKSPSTYAAWRAAVDDVDDFMFAVKGSRFITHMKQLHDPEIALANFYASGVLALGERTGPFLWQLPERLAFDRPRLERFFAALPRSSAQAAALARTHDGRIAKARELVEAHVDVPYRHALEPRHPSFFTDEARAFLREHEIAFVSADTVGRFPSSLAPTSSTFAYVRLHGAEVLYASRYLDHELASWADRIAAWSRAGLDVYAYFDNDAWGHAPFDAMRLRALVDAELVTPRRRRRHATSEESRSARRTRRTSARGAHEPHPRP